MRRRLGLSVHVRDGLPTAVRCPGAQVSSGGACDSIAAGRVAVAVAVSGKARRGGAWERTDAATRAVGGRPIPITVRVFFSTRWIGCGRERAQKESARRDIEREGRAAAWLGLVVSLSVPCLNSDRVRGLGRGRSGRVVYG